MSILIFGIEEELCSISWIIFAHLTSSSPTDPVSACCRRNSFSWWGTFYQETTKHNIDIAGAWWGGVDIIHALISSSGREDLFCVRSIPGNSPGSVTVPRFRQIPSSGTWTWVVASNFCDCITLILITVSLYSCFSYSKIYCYINNNVEYYTRFILQKD